MEYGNLDNIWEDFKNSTNPDVCNHEWDYMIQNMDKVNIFIELCQNCFDTKGIVERFID